MPNLKQQKRRVEIAARQRLENVRYRSTAKTIFRRLEQAVADGDKTRAAEEHRELVRLLDRAAARKAIHPNKAARKKSQAQRLLGGKTYLRAGSGACFNSPTFGTSASSAESRLAPLSAASSSASRMTASSSSSRE